MPNELIYTISMALSAFSGARETTRSIIRLVKANLWPFVPIPGRQVDLNSSLPL